MLIGRTCVKDFFLNESLSIGRFYTILNKVPTLSILNVSI